MIRSTLIELAGARAEPYQPTARILTSHLEAFGRALKKRLNDRWPEFAKRYLNILVDEIVINGDEAAIRGATTDRRIAVQRSEETGLDQVPSLMGEWRARRDSNSRPPGS